MKKKPSDLLGLSRAEEKVLFIIASEKLSVSEISRRSKIPKTTLNYVVRKLENRGLLEYIKKGERKLWMISDAHDLCNRFTALGESFGGRTGEGITTISISRNTRVEIYQGTESLYKLWGKFVSLHKTERLYAIQPDKSFNSAISHIIKKLSFKDLVDMNEKILNSNIIVEALVHERSVESIAKTISSFGHDPVPFLAGFLNRPADTARLPADFMDVNAEMYMHNDTFTIIHWADTTAVSITNKDVTRFFKEMFESLKYFCEKYDQNERVARKIAEMKPQ